MSKHTLINIIIGLLFSPLSYSSNINEYVFTQINSSSGLSDNQIRNIIQTDDGRMIFTTEGNLNIYDGSSFKYIHRADSNIYNLNEYSGFYRVYTEADSLIWIKENHKLMCVSLRQERYLGRTEIAQILGREQLKDFFVDSKNERWELREDGLLYDISDKGIDAGISRNRILQDIICRGDSVYLLYNDGSLKSVNKRSGDIFYENRAYNETKCGLYAHTSNILETEEGFFQIRNGLRSILLYYDFKSNRWSELYESDSWLNTMALDADNNLFVSCRDGVLCIGFKNNEIDVVTTLKTDNGREIRSEISSVFIDRDGGFWLGTLNKGVLYYHNERYKLDYFGKRSFNPASDDDIYVLGFTSAGDSVFVKTSEGVFLLRRNNNCVSRINNIEVLNKKIRSELNNIIPSYSSRHRVDIALKDKEGNEWRGTKDGLELKRNDERKLYYTENGLINNNIKSIVEGSDCKIYISTSHGISAITLKDEAIATENYNKLDGALDEEFIEGSAHVSDNGDIFFGGINGFNVIRKNDKKSRNHSAAPLLKSISIHGEKIIPGRRYNNKVLIEDSPSFTGKIVLDYNQNFISLEYAGLNYKNNAHTSYKYILEGIDQNEVFSNYDAGDGSYSSGTFRAVYTSIPPGEYRFRIWSSFRSGDWVEAKRPLVIVVNSPWWKTDMAYFIYIFCFAFLLISVIKLYAYSTKKALEIKHKEEMLLMKIKSLVDECNRYQSEAEIKEIPDDVESKDEQLSEEQTGFISQAVELVEKNLNNNYSVEQLSKDMGMDRTGLYKKLNSAIDISPSLFIRSIRLRRAAQLIEENKISITEISDSVGFSSASYMSKCFIEEFGCKPSEYISKKKNERINTAKSQKY